VICVSKRRRKKRLISERDGELSQWVICYNVFVVNREFLLWKMRVTPQISFMLNRDIFVALWHCVSSFFLFSVIFAWCIIDNRCKRCKFLHIIQYNLDSPYQAYKKKKKKKGDDQERILIKSGIGNPRILNI
jgi:hypothetical protein